MNELSELSMITGKIYMIRGVQVMLDSDLAQLYHVETKALNQAVKRNPERFPERFMFQLQENEYVGLRSQIVSSNKADSRGGRRYLPYVFTEQGVAMLSTVLHSYISVDVSIKIMDAFVLMRHYLADNAVVFQRLDRLELKGIETDENFKQIFKQLESSKQPNAIIFFKGQIWDAVSCIEEIIIKATKSIILIDNYVDKGTLDILCKKEPDVLIQIYTSKKNCKLTETEIDSFKKQYGKLEIRCTDEFHDRFLILDDKEFFHIGASIKDAGKKAFEISINKDEKSLQALLNRLKTKSTS